MPFATLLRLNYIWFRLGPIYIQWLRRHCDIAPKSIPCILVCTVIPGRSNVAETSLPNRFATHSERRRSDVAGASLFLDVYGLLQRVKDAKETVHCVECWLQPNLILVSMFLVQWNLLAVTELVVMVFSHWATPRTRMIAITRMIIMGSTIICRALHIALRQIATQIPIEFCTLVICLRIGLVLGVAQCEYTINGIRYIFRWPLVDYSPLIWAVPAQFTCFPHIVLVPTTFNWK